MDLQQYEQRPDDNCLHGAAPAWFGLALKMAPMVFDHINCQVIISIFPYLQRG